MLRNNDALSARALSEDCCGAFPGSLYTMFSEVGVDPTSISSSPTCTRSSLVLGPVGSTEMSFSLLPREFGTRRVFFRSQDRAKISPMTRKQLMVNSKREAPPRFWSEKSDPPSLLCRDFPPKRRLEGASAAALLSGAAALLLSGRGDSVRGGSFLSSLSGACS